MENKDLTPEEKLQAENELKALKLELEHNASTFISEDAPPEIIRQWLDNVAAYEEQFANAEKITIYEFTGNPEYKAPEALADEELEPAIEALLQHLQENGVVIDRPEHLTPRGYYRFLVQDFLVQEMTNYGAPGLVHYFSYDEFRTDGPEFIRQHAEEFILELLNLERPFQGIWLADECRDERNVLTREETLRRIEVFRSKYKEIIPIGFKPEDFKLTEVGMYFMFGIAWEGRLKSTGEKERHEGMGVCQMGLIDGEWLVEGVMIPGFAF